MHVSEDQGCTEGAALVGLSGAQVVYSVVNNVRIKFGASGPSYGQGALPSDQLDVWLGAFVLAHTGGGQFNVTYMRGSRLADLTPCEWRCVPAAADLHVVNIQAQMSVTATSPPCSAGDPEWSQPVTVSIADKCPQHSVDSPLALVVGARAFADTMLGSPPAFALVMPLLPSDLGVTMLLAGESASLWVASASSPAVAAATLWPFDPHAVPAADTNVSAFQGSAALRVTGAGSLVQRFASSPAAAAGAVVLLCSVEQVGAAAPPAKNLTLAAWAAGGNATAWDGESSQPFVAALGWQQSATVKALVVLHRPGLFRVCGRLLLADAPELRSGSPEVQMDSNLSSAGLGAILLSGPRMEAGLHSCVLVSIEAPVVAFTPGVAEESSTVEDVLLPAWMDPSRDSSLWDPRMCEEGAARMRAAGMPVAAARGAVACSGRDWALGPGNVTSWLSASSGRVARVPVLRVSASSMLAPTVTVSRSTGAAAVWPAVVTQMVEGGAPFAPKTTLTVMAEASITIDMGGLGRWVFQVRDVQAVGCGWQEVMSGATGFSQFALHPPWLPCCEGCVSSFVVEQSMTVRAPRVPRQPAGDKELRPGLDPAYAYAQGFHQGLDHLDELPAMVALKLSMTTWRKRNVTAPFEARIPIAFDCRLDMQVDMVSGLGPQWVPGSMAGNWRDLGDALAGVMNGTGVWSSERPDPSMTIDTSTPDILSTRLGLCGRGAAVEDGWANPSTLVANGTIHWLRAAQGLLWTKTVVAPESRWAKYLIEQDPNGIQLGWPATLRAPLAERLDPPRFERPSHAALPSAPITPGSRFSLRALVPWVQLHCKLPPGSALVPGPDSVGLEDAGGWFPCGGEWGEGTFVPPPGALGGSLVLRSDYASLVQPAPTSAHETECAALLAPGAPWLTVRASALTWSSAEGRVDFGCGIGGAAGSNVTIPVSAPPPVPLNLTTTVAPSHVVTNADLDSGASALGGSAVLQVGHVLFVGAANASGAAQAGESGQVAMFRLERMDNSSGTPTLQRQGGLLRREWLPRAPSLQGAGGLSERFGTSLARVRLSGETSEASLAGLPDAPATTFTVAVGAPRVGGGGGGLGRESGGAVVLYRVRQDTLEAEWTDTWHANGSEVRWASGSRLGKACAAMARDATGAGGVVGQSDVLAVGSGVATTEDSVLNISGATQGAVVLLRVQPDGRVGPRGASQLVIAEGTPGLPGVAVESPGPNRAVFDNFGRAIAALPVGTDPLSPSLPMLAVTATHDSGGAVWLLTINASDSQFDAGIHGDGTFLVRAFKPVAAADAWPDLSSLVSRLGPRVGYAADAPGDLDGDGVPDLVLGCPFAGEQYDSPVGRRGALLVLHLAVDQATGAIGIRGGTPIGSDDGELLSGVAADGDMLGLSLTTLAPVGVAVPYCIRVTDCIRVAERLSDCIRIAKQLDKHISILNAVGHLRATALTISYCLPLAVRIA
ncbi:hypothetical protein FNF31_04674 [Cafeteria roenbergensis]|uniref:Uncharacterized protein n=1 Tax=Cafeteria roenbergensis TaxID=33653 RepID=A0A5A8D352_CAFRO|nr:hypothetical protein FNF31_04674 [Cafeteria roenbergensis]